MTSPMAFPVTCVTNEIPSRRITLLGASAIDPDVWVAKFDDDEIPAWVVMHSGGICHPTTDVQKHRVLPWVAR
jgi:hypothetical protein